jgi:hypothetical protein
MTELPTRPRRLVQLELPAETVEAGSARAAYQSRWRNCARQCCFEADDENYLRTL